MEAILPQNEKARLAALASYQILDTLPEQTYDDLTHLASSICDAPMALITFIDQERQWFKAKVGVDIGQTPRAEAFCAHTILQPQEMLIVPDARQDPRFADNPLVQGESHVRFYAGAPLVTSDGCALGTICVIDNTTRQLTAQQKHSLQALARQVMVHLELRRTQVQRERAEQAKHFLASIVESSEDSILTINFERVITSWNRAAERLYGYRAEEVLGQPLTLLTLPQDLQQVLGNIDRIKHSQAVEIFDTIRVNKDGRDMHLEVALSPVKDTAGEVIGVSTIARDITQRKQVEQALRLSEMRYRSLFESNPHPMWVYDRVTFDFLAVNDAAVNHYGYSRDEFLGMSLKDIRPPEEIPAFLVHVSKSEPPDGKRGIRRHCKKDGTVIEVEITTHDFLFEERAARLVLANDVTARRAAEKQISFQAHLMNEVGQAIITTDKEGMVIYWNRYAETLYGWAAQDAMGKKIHTLTVPEMAVGQAEEIMALLNRGERWSGEFTVQRRDGTTFPAAVTNTPVYDEAGTLSGVIGISQDITERKLAEEALEARTREIVTTWESMTDAFYNLDMQWNITHINSQAAHLSRKSVEEMMGRNIWEEFPHLVGSMTEQKYRSAVEKQVAVSFEAFSAPFDSWYEIHAYPSALGLSVYFRDISDRKQAEKELYFQKALLEAQTEATLDGILVVSEESDERRILSYNQRLVQMWGIPPEVVASGDDAAFRKAILDQCVNREEVVARANSIYENPTQQPREEVMLLNGRVFDRYCTPIADPKGLYHGRVWFFRDITEAKRAESALRQSEARFQSIVANVPGMVYQVIMQPDGPVEWPFVSDGSWAIFEVGPETIQQHPLLPFEMLHPEDRLECERSIAASAAALLPWQWEGKLHLASGTLRWIQVMALPQRLPDGATLWDGLITDITSLKNAETILHQANDELELHVMQRTTELEAANESLRVENIEHQMTMETLRELAQALQKSKEEADEANAAKSEFLSRMSHELRTPLNAILGFGQILDRQQLTPLQSESVGHILKGGRHLLGLINEVLDISRVEAGSAELSLEPVKLDELVNDACALVQPLAHQSQIRFENSLFENSLPLQSTLHVMADRQRLHQVLINLLSNAIKYNRPGGAVTISGQQVESGRVQIRVQDSGWGLSAQEVEKLFTPFERLQAANSGIEGTGLGLVISQRLITAMGGTLGVESEVGVGSTFIIELPQAQAPGETLTEPETSQLALEPGPTEQETARTYSVLSIEDNVSNMRLMETILATRPEITLLAAMQGSIGLDMARQHHPDVILLDLHLPGLSGSEVLEQLQGAEATRDIPVIVISADATAKQIERLLSAGAAAYLTKPLDVAAFLSTIDEVLQRNG